MQIEKLMSAETEAYLKNVYPIGHAATPSAVKATLADISDDEKNSRILRDAITVMTLVDDDVLLATLESLHQANRRLYNVLPRDQEVKDKFTTALQSMQPVKVDVLSREFGRALLLHAALLWLYLESVK